MGTQKGAHGCATTQPPFLQTPQLPGTATARPEVTRLLPTMHLPPSVFPSFHPLSVSLSVRPSIHSPLRRSFPSHSAFVSLLSLARCSTPPPPFSFHLLSTRTPLSFTCVHVVRDCLVDASRRAFEGGGGEMFFGRMWTMRFFGKFERLEEGVIIAQSVECN